jgi:hypothetical protein
VSRHFDLVGYWSIQGKLLSDFFPL